MTLNEYLRMWKEFKQALWKMDLDHRMSCADKITLFKHYMELSLSEVKEGSLVMNGFTVPPSSALIDKALAVGESNPHENGQYDEIC